MYSKTSLAESKAKCWNERRKNICNSYYRILISLIYIELIEIGKTKKSSKKRTKDLKIVFTRK